MKYLLVTKQYNYPAPFTHNRLSSFTAGGSTYHYTYDANGNILTENTDRHLGWNFADKLTFFKKQAGGGSPSIWVHYLYAPDGTRVKKVVNKPGGIQEVTVYTCPERSRRIDGLYEHSYTKNSGTLDATRHYNTLHISDGESRVATLRVGNDADDSSPAQKFFISDHLGNCSVTVQANGARYNLEEFYPFGETSFGSYAKKRYRYNGKERDGESGYYEYGQRYYAPWLCRFVSVDPIAEKFAQLSAYNYAGNMPIDQRDLDGLQGENQDESAKSSHNTSQGTEPAEQNEILDLGRVHFINKETGKYLGSHDFGGEGESIRSISHSDYVNLTGSEFNTIPAVPKWDIPEISVLGNSSEVDIDLDKISKDLAAMSEESYDDHGRIIENSMYLIYDSEQNTITSEVRNEGNTFESTADNLRYELTDKRDIYGLKGHPATTLIIAQIHTHPDANYVSAKHRSVHFGAKTYSRGNAPGVSEKDFELSKLFPVYALALFQDNSLHGQNPGAVSVYSILGNAKSESDYTTLEQSYLDLMKNPTPMIVHSLINR